MSDNDWRNARIEDAAKAIVEVEYPDIAWGLLNEKRKEFRRRQARAALAVFEKALGEATVTPTAHEVTSDEREALAKAMCAIETRSKSATLEEVQAGIQRWTRHRHEADRLIEELADYGLSIRRSEVPEPSAKHPLCGCPCHTTPSMKHIVPCCVPEPQGEPSDARVLAAFNTFFGLELPLISEGSMDRMRAALRAASAVTEQTEKP